MVNISEWSLLAVASLLVSTGEAWSPTNGYVPANVTCPDDINLVRNATFRLSNNETEWLKKREVHTSEALKDFLTRSLANFSDTSILDDLFGGNSTKIPKLGIAASGGGYRAMLSGAGMIAAMDNRTIGANQHGLGGLLQSATYLAGLSGGNWLTGTLAWNNWTSVQDIVNNFTVDGSIWDIDHSIVNPGGINVFKSGSRWDHISDAVEDKQKAGFNVSLADVWGRALSYNWFPNLYRGGIGYTWSTLRDAEVFQDGAMPFPISVADGRYPGTKVINLNATLFEFNPFEMGSWDPTVNSFTDVKYLGTNVSNGKPVNTGKCIAGFDNTGFIIATSSTLFNQFLLRINGTKLPKFIVHLATHFLTDLSNDYNDIAIYSPNPFKDTEFQMGNASKSISESRDLFLVDGGEDNQNIPLNPLIQKQRDLDIVFALDNSADTNQSWPDGASLVNTYQRQFSSQGKHAAFPYVPDVNTFVNLGLNKRPTFFGCDANNLTDLAYIPPLVVYIPNAKYSFNSNQSTFKMSYSAEQRRAMIQNGFEAATRNNFTDDSNFMGCIGCAIIRRKQQAFNYTLPKECDKCFSDYCWNGTLNTTAAYGVVGAAAVESAQLSSAEASLASASSASTSATKNKDGVTTTLSSTSKKNDAPGNFPSNSIFTLLSVIATVLGLL